MVAAMETLETLLVERADGIVTVTMNRPEKKNAATPAMWRELHQTFVDIAGRPEDRVMILTGAGGAFCSGADLGAPGDLSNPEAMMRRVSDTALALHRLPKPTIAKVTGMAAGAGCNMALGCDLIVASEEARFCEIFSRRGLSLDFGGSWVLPRLVGMARAKELSFFGDMVSAEEAAQMGLVNRVVAAGEIDVFVDDWARRLTAGPPIALSMTKNLLDQAFDVSLLHALEEEGRCQTINFSTRDFAEGGAAFMEKRPPRFEGR